MKGWYKTDTKQYFQTQNDLNAWQRIRSAEARTHVSDSSSSEKLGNEVNDTQVEQMALISQGAEGKVYFSRFLGRESVTKERVRKSYREPALDAKLNKTRLLQEARCMVKAQQLGIDVPRVFMVDTVEYKIHMERVEGMTFKALLHRDMSRQRQERLSSSSSSSAASASSPLFSSSSSSSSSSFAAMHIPCDSKAVPNVNVNVNSNANTSDNVYSDYHYHLAECVGKALACLHSSHIVHGDLTTSNFMIRDNAPHSIVVIDFGLGSMQALPEDKAVDIYVLERAFLATHPGSEALVERVVSAYSSMYDTSVPKETEKEKEGKTHVEDHGGDVTGSEVKRAKTTSLLEPLAPVPDPALASVTLLPVSSVGTGRGIVKTQKVNKNADNDKTRHENCVAVLRRLEAVRMRGRKRDMFG